MKYEARLKGLKQKYRHLNGKVPVHSYDNRELKQLEENKLQSRYEFYKFKKEINLDELLSTIEEMKKLQEVYAELKRGGNNKDEIKQTEGKYNDLLKIYENITGSKYSAAIGVYLAGLPPIEKANNAGLSAIAEEKTANIAESANMVERANIIESKNMENTGEIGEIKVIKKVTAGDLNWGSSNSNEESVKNESSESNETSGSNETSESNESSNTESSANSGANETKQVNFSV